MSKLGIGSVLLTLAAWEANAMQAGAKKIEITPPPGYPTGGHGPAGDISRGYWNRLYARAFVIKGDSGPGVILVSCDSFAVPLGLNAEIWKRIDKTASPLGFRAESLILAATHTHQGPGNYLTAQVYNEFGSRESGYSKPLFEFFADRISLAVLEAVRNLADAEIRSYSAQVTPNLKDQFIMNRSPKVFMLNWDREKVLDDLNADRYWPTDPAEAKKQCLELRGDDSGDGWDLPGCPRLRAVDRRLTILEIVHKNRPARTPSTRIGALVFFAVHPTALVHSAPFYNSDFVGQALDSLESEWAKAGASDPVAGFFNGGEGDVTPRRDLRNIEEVTKRSTQFHDAIESAMKSVPKIFDSVPTLVSARIFDTRQPNDRLCRSTGADIAELAPEPSFGAAGVGGGELDRTILYPLGWREGVRRPPQDGQGTKLPALDANVLPDLKFTHLLAPAKHFPRYLPLTYAEIGDFVLAAVPVEMSSTAALRIRTELEKKTKYVQVLGLANEYGSYSSTESEYAAQDYMGASTLWGPQEAAFFGCRLADLQNSPPPAFQVPSDVSKPGPAPRKAGPKWLLLSLIRIYKSTPFGPVFVGEPREFPDDGLDDILMRVAGAPERHLPFFEWQEEVTDQVAEFEATPGRKIVVLTEAGDWFDDSNADFLTLLTKGPSPLTPHTRTWAVIWLKPLQQELPGMYRFRITPNRAPAIESEAFSVNLANTGKPHAIPPRGVVLHPDAGTRPVPRLRHYRHRF